MRRLLGILLLLAMYAAQLPAAACHALMAPAPAPSQGTEGVAHGPAAHGHEHASRAGAPAGALDAEDGHGSHDAGCALLMRCQWSALPALAAQRAPVAAITAQRPPLPASAAADPAHALETPPPKHVS